MIEEEDQTAQDASQQTEQETKTESDSKQETENQEPLPPIDVNAFVEMMIQQLGECAWAKMGLVPDPLSGKIEKDMQQAKIAIDCAASLMETIKPTVSDDQKREYSVMLSNLRMNYVRQQG